MKAAALVLSLLLASCASMDAEEWADALSSAGRVISAKGREMRPVVDPMGPSRIRPF